MAQIRKQQARIAPQPRAASTSITPETNAMLHSLQAQDCVSNEAKNWTSTIICIAIFSDEHLSRHSTSLQPLCRPSRKSMKTHETREYRHLAGSAAPIQTDIDFVGCRCNAYPVFGSGFGVDVMLLASLRDWSGDHFTPPGEIDMQFRLLSAAIVSALVISAPGFAANFFASYVFVNLRTGKTHGTEKPAPCCSSTAPSPDWPTSRFIPPTR